MNKKSRGDMLVPLIFIIVAFAVLLASGAMLNKSATNPTEQYSMGQDTVDPQQQNLQLQTLKPKRFIPPTLDCGTGALISGEPYILWAIDPAPGNIVQKDGKIKVFYLDELPITLGAGNITLPKNNQDHAVDPSVGDESAKDRNGFPYFPALFLSDITSDPTNTSGDVQKGGSPHKPNEIFGAWKALGNVSTGNVQPNNLDIGPNADPYPKDSNVKFTGYGQRHDLPNYGAEIIWDVKTLGLIEGHVYRAQIILHDGDQEGDTSEACTTIQN